MCGICGELRFDGSSPATERLRAMSKAVAYRGPDDDGIEISGPLGFGHRRLAIIDLSQAAHQPMLDPELGLSIVFNGTIYNYPELRSELIQAGYRFFSHGDTEVILKAFHHWGEECVERLHGMFAFAIWQEQKQALFLARDRNGIKPLYFSSTDRHFRFASNTRALLAAGDVDTRVDPVALHHQLTLHAVVPAPRTLLRGISKLPPATTLSIDAKGGRRERVYWRLQATRPQAALSEQEWIEAIHAALQQAVDRRMRIADVPVGVLLSGGLDSSLLVALLREAGSSDLKTFSIGFEDQPEESGSEFYYSDQVVARYATNHEKILIPNQRVLEELPNAVDHMAEPMVAQDAVAFYLLSQQVSRHVKVVQSGQGADEVFGGYFWYPQMHRARGDAVQRFAPYYFDRDHEEYLETVTTRYWGEDYTSQLVGKRLQEAEADEYIDQVLRFDTTTLIVDDPVKRVDNMTMAWGLEARVPFLDQQVVETAARMPPELKLRSDGKHVLKQISRPLLPADVIDRPKGYFPVPALKYVRDDFLTFMRDILHSKACRERGLFQTNYVEKLLSEPESHLTRLRGSKLWHLALLEFWLQRHVDAPM